MSSGSKDNLQRQESRTFSFGIILQVVFFPCEICSPIQLGEWVHLEGQSMMESMLKCSWKIQRPCDSCMLSWIVASESTIYW